MSTADIKRLHDAVRGGNVDAALELADELIGGCGVEALRGDGWASYYCDIVALYANTGDTYDETVIYDVGRRRFYVGSIGDWIESAESRGVTVY